MPDLPSLITYQMIDIGIDMLNSVRVGMLGWPYGNHPRQSGLIRSLICAYDQPPDSDIALGVELPLL